MPDTFGETKARDAGGRIHKAVATVAALALVPKNECVDGQILIVAADPGGLGPCSTWQFQVSANGFVDATSNLIVSPSDATTVGTWVRVDKFVDLKFAVSFATTDAAVLFTVPTGFRLQPIRPFWEVAVGWTGGAASTIGLSSSNAAYATKGDLLGAAAGDAAAVLIVASPGPFVGAQGAKLAGAAPVVLVAADTIKFNQITSTYTAGSGFAHVPCHIIEA